MHTFFDLALMLRSSTVVLYNTLMLTSKEYAREVMDVTKAEWLIEVAPFFFKPSDLEIFKDKKVPKGKGMARQIEAGT